MKIPLAILLLATSCGIALAADPPLPEGGNALLTNTTKAQFSIPPEVGGVTSLTIADAPANPVIRAEVNAPPTVPWKAFVAYPLGSAIMKGDVCLLGFQMRALSRDGASARGSIGVNVQLNPSHEKTAEQQYKPTAVWQKVRLPFRSEFAIPQGSGVINLVFGSEKQTVELCDLQLTNYGPQADLTKLPRVPGETYEGREANAPWRKIAAANIEKHRKSELRVVVVDASGKPVPNAQVRVNLKRHAFGFGSAVTADQILNWKTGGDKYRAMVEENFSRVVLENDLKTPNWMKADETERAAHRTRTMETLGWLRGKEIPVRGHFLAWCYTQPWNESYFKAKDVPGIKRQIYDHMDSVLKETGYRLIEWDVINHPVAFGNNIADLAGPQVYAEILKEARKRTGLGLWVNEDLFDSRWRQDRYFEVVKRMIDDGAAPDGIGNMAHFRGANLTGIPDWLDMSDRFATLVPNLAVTEYDLETENDALQADYLRDLLTATFSHPAYTQFIMWGFWEGKHWRPQAALWRKDWSEKPSGKAWRELVKEKWHTRAEGRADGKGNYRIRGFHGAYEITVNSNGIFKTVNATLAKEGSEIRVALAK